ncbi:MAG TPA: hypothetical protein VNT32_05975, partial [Thermoleophilaceae bacterium]|nr:hypothetical protein [Thermoleophilaceae bacterium]
MNAEAISTHDPRSDGIRTLGGVLFAAGAIVLFIRKSSTGDWGDLALLLTLVVPFVALYGLGLTGPAGSEPWRAVYIVLGVLIAPLALFQFLEWIGGSTDDSLNGAWIFAVVGALGAVASHRRDALYAALLAALAFLAAWLLLWDKLLDNPEIDTFRWLLVILALIYAAAAFALRGAGHRQASELITGAALAAVTAGGLAAIETAASLSGAAGLGAIGGGADANAFWDIFLLVVSVGAIAYGVQAGARGPVYAGGLGLFAFIVVVGVELSKLTDGETPGGDLVGWPLILLLVGGGAAAGPGP